MSRYGGRYASSGPRPAFSVSASDFQRDGLLKRRRQQSPARSSAAVRPRSKSKSRARATARKLPGQQFIALGSNRAASVATSNTNKASYYHTPAAAARGRSRSKEAAPARRNLSPVSTRTRSKSVTKEKEDTAAAIRRSKRERSKSAARRSGGAPLSRSTETSDVRTSRKRDRSKSETRERERGGERERGRSASRSRRSGRSRTIESSSEERKSSRRSSRSGSSLQEIEAAMAATERELNPKKEELEELREQLAKLKKRVDVKELEVYDLQVDLDALRKRRERRLPSHSSREEMSSRRSNSKGKSQRRESRRSSSRSRVSKRPCIVDKEDEDDSDDDVVLMDPAEVKKELESASATTTASSTVVPVEDTTPDYFWGRSNVPKLLGNHRFRAIPDGSARKGRHLSFNPIQPSIFATSPDEGGLILWNYQRQDQDIAKVVTLLPSSFRRDNPCAEAISWSPDGNRLAMAFRDPLDGKGEFCIVQLHQLKLEDSNTPQAIPRDRITSKSTTLHSRGVSAIDWLPTGYGSDMTSRQLITTGNSDHAVVLWEEHEDMQNGGLDLKWRVLHRDHRSEVKSLCVHSKRDSLYTGGLDGLLIRYDMHKGRTNTVIERRRPAISKMNAVLEHPHNPNLLLVSCVEQSKHNLLLHDLRQRYRSDEMSLSWGGSSMSQYVVPRWSPAGYHVSCGSKSGVVNIWDVRMRGDDYPTVQPQQTLTLHQKTVLHATWHPRYDAMFSVSHDRTIGLLTFR